MFARLWWKEWRAFGPVGLMLALGAAVVQWLFLAVNPAEFRSGALTPVALIYAVLYAFAVGSAAFAGEWDSGTMGFLDALPIGRPRLWLGKATFAMASTIALALLLTGLAALGTESRARAVGYPRLVGMFGPLLFEGIAWGLLWSTLSRNPLIAGAMSMVSVATVVMILARLVTSGDLDSPVTIAMRLLAASAALAASALIFTYQHRFSFPTIVPARTDLRPARRWKSPFRRSSTARSLDWQARREGRTTVVLVVLLVLVVPVVMRLLLGPYRDGGMLALALAVLANLVAGVAVFGVEGGSATPRFLVNHGVRPGVVWWRKMSVWGLTSAVFLGIFLFVNLAWLIPVRGAWSPQGLGQAWGQTGLAQSGYGILPIAAVILDAFAVGMICGMAIPRRITAALVGALGVLAIAPVQVVLTTTEMIPEASLFLTPVILLGASRAWVGDWMTDREGARPWVRLGLFLAVPALMLVPAYVAWRAWGVPDVGPQFVAGGAYVVAIPPGQDAAEEYRRAAALAPSGGRFYHRVLGVDQIIERGWDPERIWAVDLWSENRPALEIARRASSLPFARSVTVEKVSDDSRFPATSDIEDLSVLLALDFRERLSRGDLAGAWEDILGLFRMANHQAGTTPTPALSRTSANLHHRAVRLAIDWAGDPRQTPDRLRGAIDDLRRLPPLPSAAESLRDESLRLDRTLNLPAEDLDRLLNRSSSAKPTSPWLLAPWWERTRARRVCRRMIAEMLAEVARDPWQRSPGTRFDPVPIGSPLARRILPSFKVMVDALDRQSAGRRALEQILAIRSWQLAHGGLYPDRLEVLVPSVLDRLPFDPYSGRPFGYFVSSGQSVPPPNVAYFRSPDERRPTRPGQPILYSTGPDRKGGLGTFSFEAGSGQGGGINPPPP